jgi:prolyl oligopeptidase
MRFSCTVTPELDDEYLWLEEIDGPKAIAWIDEHTSAALAQLTGERFERFRAEIRDVLDDDRRIVYPTVRGDHVYELWQDASHVRGLWRRTTKSGYASAKPEWDVLLDVDALGAAEAESWVLSSVKGLKPYNRFLLGLSRGGSDAEVFREFDVAMKRFVHDGYALPEAKTAIEWLDHDRVLVATDFGPGSLTTSGYARIAKLWPRGTALEDAETVFEARENDMIVVFATDHTPGFERTFVVRWLDFINRDVYLRRDDGSLVTVPIPQDAWWGVHADWLLVRLRTPWLGHPAGALLAGRFESFMDGERGLDVLFEPTPNSALLNYWFTRDHVVISSMTDVQDRLTVWTPTAEGWQRSEPPAAGTGITTTVVDTSPEEDNEYFVASEGFLQPAALRRGFLSADGEAGEETVREAPAFFDADGMTSQQLFATSEDGTRIPYFLVGRLDGTPKPTMLRAYGGFGVSLLPEYQDTVGRTWLAQGGLLAVANIRGGGEYGPEWREAARREKRPRAYEDFAAVAADLVARGITTVPQLGAWGGSNGGLLMGVMLTRYPELFGAIVARAPLLDMLRYHKLLAGASWMAEYGDPDVAEDRAFIAAYSPYQNVRAGMAYPPILFTASTRDDRVHPGHARKMAARLLAHGYDVTFYENREGGHAGAADHEQQAFVTALTTEFLWQRLDA